MATDRFKAGTEAKRADAYMDAAMAARLANRPEPQGVSPLLVGGAALLAVGAVFALA